MSGPLMCSSNSCCGQSCSVNSHMSQISFQLTSISMNSRLMTLAWGLGRLQMAASQNVQITLPWAPQCQNYTATKTWASYCKAGWGIPLLYGCYCRVARPRENYNGNGPFLSGNYTFQYTARQHSYSEQKGLIRHLCSAHLSSQPHSMGASPTFPCEKIKVVLESQTFHAFSALTTSSKPLQNLVV